MPCSVRGNCPFPSSALTTLGQFISLDFCSSSAPTFVAGLVCIPQSSGRSHSAGKAGRRKRSQPALRQAAALEPVCL